MIGPIGKFQIARFTDGWKMQCCKVVFLFVISKHPLVGKSCLRVGGDYSCAVLYRLPNNHLLIITFEIFSNPPALF